MCFVIPLYGWNKIKAWRCDIMTDELLHENEQRIDSTQEKINWHKMKIIIAQSQIQYHEKEIKQLLDSC